MKNGLTPFLGLPLGLLLLYSKVKNGVVAWWRWVPVSVLRFPYLFYLCFRPYLLLLDCQCLGVSLSVADFPFRRLFLSPVAVPR